MAKKNDHLYPAEGEPWTGITTEELEKKGFKLTTSAYYVHPKCKEIGLQKIHGEWNIFFYPAYTEDEPGVIRIREVKYMYQIDNMFHGFTDRWLGYI